MSRLLDGGPRRAEGLRARVDIRPHRPGHTGDRTLSGAGDRGTHRHRIRAGATVTCRNVSPRRWNHSCIRSNDMAAVPDSIAG